MQISLKAARVNANLTQDEAAARIGVTKATIRNWEKGRSYPTAHQIEIIQREYGVPYDHLNFLPNNHA